MFSRPYFPPQAEILPVSIEEMLASSYNPDNDTEYIDEDYGGLI